MNQDEYLKNRLSAGEFQDEESKKEISNKRINIILKVNSKMPPTSYNTIFTNWAFSLGPDKLGVDSKGTHPHRLKVPGGALSRWYVVNTITLDEEARKKLDLIDEKNTPLPDSFILTIEAPKYKDKVTEEINRINNTTETKPIVKVIPKR